MEQLSVGEDLFATIIVVGLIVLLVAVLAHSYHTYAERKNMHESFDLALDIANQLRNDVLTKQDNRTCPGLINPRTSEQEFQIYYQSLARQGIGLRVEVRTLDGELVLAYGPKTNEFSQYFSPPCSVSLPAVIAQTPASRPIGELVVMVWR